MAEPTIDEMLTNVRTAINNAILAGGLVEMELNGRRVKYDYDQLVNIEQKLLARKASATTNGPLRTYVNFGGRPS